MEAYITDMRLASWRGGSEEAVCSHLVYCKRRAMGIKSAGLLVRGILRSTAISVALLVNTPNVRQSLDRLM
jgi:hypothetical protein